MAWQRPQLVDGEQLHVDCSQVFPNGTRFDLWVTDRRIAFSRRKAFAVSDPIETVVLPLTEVSDVRLARATPWTLRLLGLFLFSVFALDLYASLGRYGTGFSFHLLLLPVLGFACFLTSSHRWRLRFHGGGRTHLLKQPLTIERTVRDELADSLKRAGELLQPTPGIVGAPPRRSIVT